MLGHLMQQYLLLKNCAGSDCNCMGFLSGAMTAGVSHVKVKVKTADCSIPRGACKRLTSSTCTSPLHPEVKNGKSQSERLQALAVALHAS